MAWRRLTHALSSPVGVGNAHLLRQRAPGNPHVTLPGDRWRAALSNDPKEKLRLVGLEPTTSPLSGACLAATGYKSAALPIELQARKRCARVFVTKLNGI